MKKAVTQGTMPGRAARAMPSTLSSGSPLSEPRTTRGPHIPVSHIRLGGSPPFEITEDSEDGASRELYCDTGDLKSSPGIRYITEDLIKKLTKQDNLAFVRAVNLSLSKGSGKKFKFIENLEKCERLQVLNLSHNLIEKIEKLEKLHKLRELHLSHNRIRKIEGLEHMGNLQHLNLAWNSIEHMPMWLAKKLRSLQTLNLHHNNISSLHEVSQLKALKNLTELVLTENPVYNLPHCRLFLVFHLKVLEKLDGVQISQQEREQAHQRFHMEEVERLEQELERGQAEAARLREEQAAAALRLEQQESLNQSLQLQGCEQRRHQAQLERELETKSELPPLPASVLDAMCQLKRKTVELTRACQKQYELEQELAFHKIDAKFEPLPYYPDQEVEEEEDSPGESPYIGKARHLRRTLVCQDSLGRKDTECPQGDVPDSLYRSRQEEQAQGRLLQLQLEMENVEQQVLRATAELRQLEEAVSQRQISEAEKEQLRQQLRRKIQLLEQLKAESQELEGQLGKQRDDMNRVRGELDQLHSLLETLDPGDPRHAHVKAQASSKSQLLDIMSRACHELEGRLDHMLSRIAKETEEIKDLEQQLTDGQIAANEALKRDLEGIIAGLQEYLHGVKSQARRAQTDCLQLQMEKEALQRRLQESEEQRGQLETVAMDAEGAREEVAQLQKDLDELRDENAELQQAQEQMSAYEAELEAQLQKRITEAGMLQEELARLGRLGQMEQSALQAELEKERQAKENALAQTRLVAEREEQSRRLLGEFRLLQEERDSLREQVHTLQAELELTRGSLLCPQEVAQLLEELRKSVASGLGEIRQWGKGDALDRSLRFLQEELGRAVSAAQADTEEAWRRQEVHAREAAALRDKLRRAQEERRAGRDSAAQSGAEGEAELRRLKDELEEAQELQSLTERRLQEAEDERDRLLTQLEDRDHQMKVEETQTQQQLQSLDKELRGLKRSMAAADKRAAQQLNAAKDQLRSLHGTVRKINQERAEDAEELEGFRVQVAAAAEDLARAEAEIQMLQKLLKEREIQAHEVDSHNEQQQELDRLSQALGRQQAQTRRLRDQLARAKNDDTGELKELMMEIGALRDTLAQQSHFVSGLEDPVRGRGRGYWFYVPSPPNPPSVGSQGTRDSGLGSQYPPSPDRGERTTRRGQRERAGRAVPSAGGYWVFSPHRHRHSRMRRGRGDLRDSGGESDGGSSISGPQFVPPPGSAVYTMLPDGSPPPHGTVIYAPPASGLSVSPGTIIYGPPPAGAQLVYGPPPAGLAVPLIPAGVLLCNVPDHQEMDRELNQLQNELAELRDREEQREGLGRDVRRLQEQRAELERELKELRRDVGQLRKNRKVQEGSRDSLVEELKLEQSLLQHGEVLEEVECVEKTLLRRRAELREADRLLLEAESDLKDARAKTRENMQQYSEAQKRAGDTERELEELENRAQNTATQLVHANQHLRALQDEVQELQTRRAEQGQTLREVEEVVASRDTEFHSLSSKVDQATERLEALQSREAQQLEALREVETMLSQRTTELDRLNAEVALQQEEVSALDRKLAQRHEEERLLQESVEQRKRSLAEVLGQGEQEVQELQGLIKELQGDLQTLSVQKGELGLQLSERQAQLSLLKQEGQREEGMLHSIQVQIDQQRTELKHVLEMIQLESDELQGLKLQHKQRLDQLEKSQETLLQVRMELQGLEQPKAEGKRQRRLAEQERKKLEAIRQEAQALEGQCRNLEARRIHAERCMAVAEEGARAAEAELTRLEVELGQALQEQKREQTSKQEMKEEIVATRQQLEEKAEKLKGLKDQLDDARHQLELTEEAVRAAARRHDEQLAEQRRQTEDLRVEADRLEAELIERQARHEQQKQQEVADTELHKQRLHTMQTQLQTLEGAVADRSGKLEKVTARVTEMQEQGRKLQRDQEQCARLQERLAHVDRELSGRDSHLRAVRRELEECRAEVQRLKELLLTERRNAERRQTELMACGQAARQKAEEKEEELVKLQREQALVEQAAQETHQRAQRLQKELQGLKDKLRSREDEEARRQEIEEAMRSLKSEVKAELNIGILELKVPPSDTSDSESHKENYPHSAPSMRRAAFNTKDEQWRGEVLREKLRQQEDHLKAQLRRRMWWQEEALCQRRQQTEGSLQGLRRRVDKLGELLCSSATDSLSLCHNEPPIKHGRSDPSDEWSLQSTSCSPVRLDSSL